MADFTDDATRSEEQDRATAEANHRAEADRRRRIAESFRPNVPDAELRCLDCEELIGLERLRAMPRASRCAECATAWEARNRGNGWN